MSPWWPVSWGIRQFRVRDDSANLNTDAGWVAGLNARANTLTPATTYRVRFSIVDRAEQSAGLRSYKVYWRVAGGTWAALAATGKVRWASSAMYANGDACSTQLLAGEDTRAFSALGVAVEAAAALATFEPSDVVLPEYEVEVAFQLGTDAVNGEVYEIGLKYWAAAWIGPAGWMLVPGIVAEATRIVAGVAPTADFSATPLTGKAPLEVTFTDLSTNTPEAWDWDFGDGSLHGYEQNPIHTYLAAGSYTVVLIATNAAAGDTETKTGYITVTAADVWIPGEEAPAGWLPPDEVSEILWRRGHVGLGAKSYVIEANTYQKRQMPPFTQRFATGTLEYGDLSYWQYASQDDWRGGEGEELFDISTGPQRAYLKSYGVRATEPDTELRLAAKPALRETFGAGRHMLLLAWEGTPYIIGGSSGVATIRRWDEETETWSTAVDFSGTVYVIATEGYPTAVAYAPPYVVIGTSEGRLIHLNSDVMRSGEAVNVKWKDEFSRPIMQILPISAMLYFVAYTGVFASPWTGVWAVRWPQGDTTVSWTQIGLTKKVDEGAKGLAALPVATSVQMIWHQGAVWLIANTGSTREADGASAVLAWSDGADVLGYKVFPGFICKGMASIGARLLLIGNYARQAVVMTDAGVVMQRKKLPEETWDETMSEFCCVFQQHDHLLLGGSGTPRVWEMDGGFALTEAVFLPAGVYDRGVSVVNLVKAAGRYHLHVLDYGNSSAMWDCKETDRYNTHGILWVSEWDAGMREVSKLVASITVRTKKALAGGNRVEVWADSLPGLSVYRDCEFVDHGGGVFTPTLADHGFENNDPLMFGTSLGGVVVGQTYYVRAHTPDTFSITETTNGAELHLTAAGNNTVWRVPGGYLLGQMRTGNYQEFLLPATAGTVKKLSLRLKLISGASGEAPEVTSEAIRYVPLGPTKHVWSFAIKAENAIRTIDGLVESRSGLEIADDLWALIDAQLPIRFRDIDGVTYTAMVTDAIAKCPMVDKPAPEGRGPEYQVVVEMCEY